MARRKKKKVTTMAGLAGRVMKRSGQTRATQKAIAGRAAKKAVKQGAAVAAAAVPAGRVGGIARAMRVERAARKASLSINLARGLPKAKKLKKLLPAKGVRPNVPFTPPPVPAKKKRKTRVTASQRGRKPIPRK